MSSVRIATEIRKEHLFISNSRQIKEGKWRVGEERPNRPSSAGIGNPFLSADASHVKLQMKESTPSPCTFPQIRASKSSRPVPRGLC